MQPKTSDNQTCNQSWWLSDRASPLAREIADRHYNRQSIGAAQFVPPGRCVVLRQPKALWVTSWPFAEFVKHAWAGAWINSAFRNEGAGLASELILQAVAATRAIWANVPALGIVTFIDPEKVRRKRDLGYCYLKAGFERVGETEGGLPAFQLLPERMPAPLPALGSSMEMAV